MHGNKSQPCFNSSILLSQAGRHAPFMLLMDPCLKENTGKCRVSWLQTIGGMSKPDNSLHFPIVLSYIYLFTGKMICPLSFITLYIAPMIVQCHHLVYLVSTSILCTNNDISFYMHRYIDNIRLTRSCVYAL